MSQEPEDAPPYPVVFGDRAAGLSFHSDLVRLGFAAQLVERSGEIRTVPSGMLVLTIEAALELQASLHQMLSQLDAKGVVDLKAPRQDA